MGKLDLGKLGNCSIVYNESLSADKRIGIYGLNVYRFRESMNSVIHYLEKKNPKALATAKTAIKCFVPYNKDER